MNQKDFALRVRELRKEHELTQEDLAQQLGVSRQTIFLVETGQCMPSLEHAFKLATIFNHTIDSLLNEEIDSFIETHSTRDYLTIRIVLPEDIDVNQANLTLENGILEIILPKTR